MRAVALRPLLVLLAAPAHGFSGAGRAPRPLHRRGCDRGGQGGARVALLRIRMEEASTTLGCKYDHLQFFVDDLRPLSHYKAIEDRLNEFARLVPRAEGAPVDIAAAREVWRKMGDSADPNAFEVHGRDLVEQMLYGFGWRITGQHEGAETRSLLLSTPDTAGVRFVLTCNTRGGTSADSRPTAAVVMATSNPNPSPNPNPNPSPNPNRSPSPNPNPSPSPSRNPNPNSNPSPSPNQAAPAVPAVPVAARAVGEWSGRDWGPVSTATVATATATATATVATTATAATGSFDHFARVHLVRVRVS